MERNKQRLGSFLLCFFFKKNEKTNPREMILKCLNIMKKWLKKIKEKRSENLHFLFPKKNKSGKKIITQDLIFSLFNEKSVGDKCMPKIQSIM